MHMPTVLGAPMQVPLVQVRPLQQASPIAPQALQLVLPRAPPAPARLLIVYDGLGGRPRAR